MSTPTGAVVVFARETCGWWVMCLDCGGFLGPFGLIEANRVGRAHQTPEHDDAMGTTTEQGA